MGFYKGGINFPVYEEDCELLDMCDSIGSTYKMCRKGADLGSRCSPHEKQNVQMMFQQESLHKKRFRITVIIAGFTCFLSAIAAICAIVALT